MKKYTKILTLALAIASFGLMLTACSFEIITGGNTSTTEPTQQNPGTSAGSSSAGADVAETDNCDLPTGKYMLNNVVYDYDAAQKKIVITQYDNYNDYLNNRGTKKYEGTVKFVVWSSSINAIYYNDGTYDSWIYKDGNYFKYKFKRNSSNISGTISQINNLLVPQPGTYVSSCLKKSTEEYYVFVEITETSAKVYISDNGTTHGSTPVYSQDNYVLDFLHARVMIRIPHTPNTSYKCTISAKSANVIHAFNDSESNDDYSISCDLTKVE